MRINRILFYLFFFSLVLTNKISFANTVIKSSAGENAGKIRIVLELQKFPKYRVFTTSKPLQLVIDVQDCNASTQINLSHKLFKNVKISPNSANDLKIKIDLNNKIKIVGSSILKPDTNKKNYRLVIDFTELKPITKQEIKKEKVQETISNLQNFDDKNDKSKYVLSPLNNKIADEILSEADPEAGVIRYTIKKKITPEEIKEATQKKLIIPIIVIDAGHGGKDPGTIGAYARTKEKNVTLSYAREIKKALDDTGKFKTFLTRDSDFFIPLDERVSKSRRLKANLFISVHADSAGDSDTKGLSIYTLSENSSDKQAERLAQKENRADIIGGADLSKTNDDDVLKTLINLAQRNSMNDSAKFAELTIKYFDLNSVTVLQNTHRFAGFRVLTAPDTPAVLIELGYLSNKYEEQILNSPEHKERIAKSLVKAIEVYFSKIKDL